MEKVKIKFIMNLREIDFRDLETMIVATPRSDVYSWNLVARGDLLKILQEDTEHFTWFSTFVNDIVYVVNDVVASSQEALQKYFTDAGHDVFFVNEPPWKNF